MGSYPINVDFDYRLYPNYDISTVINNLIITPRPLVLNGGSDRVVYDGKTHTIIAYSIEGLFGKDKIVEGVTYSASGQEVGTYDGVFIIDLDKLKIVNEDGVDVTKCYTIDENPGQLIIDPASSSSSSSSNPSSSTPSSSSSTPTSSSSSSSSSSPNSSNPSSSTPNSILILTLSQLVIAILILKLLL